MENTQFESPAIESHQNETERGASVEKIRDIIFGSQIRNYEARFIRLEENLVRETTELKDLIRKRFESIESFLKRESETLAAGIRAEREERTSLISNLEREMKDADTTLGRRLNDLLSTMSEGHSSLRSELMTESGRLLEEIGQRNDSVRSLMEVRISELRTHKADRALLSDLLREMAAQLDNDGPSPE